MAKKVSRELIPPADSNDVAKRVFDVLEQVVADKETMNLESKWFRFYELGKNRQWRKHSEDLTLVSANLLSVHRRRTVNTLTDNNPTFNIRRIISRDDTDIKFETVLRATEYWWGETEQQDILEESIINGETYGVCIEKVVFDLEKEYGIGEVDTVVVDPFHFGIYPVKEKKIQKAQAILHYYPMSVRDIKRIYGDAAKEVVADSELINSLDDDRRYVSGVKETVTGRGSSSTTIGGSVRNLMSTVMGSTANDDSDEAVVVECWMKDYTPKEDGTPLYPGHIRVVTCVNGTIVLSDKANPSVNPDLPQETAAQTYLYDKFPFSKANSNKDPVNFWGESDFEQLTGLQMELNKALSQFSSLKDKVAGVKFINPKTSGVDNAKITTGASILNPSVANHGMEYANPPPIPRELVESLTMYKELFFAVAGTFDLEQANTPGSQVIAYKAIAALIERASTMMRGKVRNYSKLIRDRGRMAVSMMQNWYTEPRFITFTKDGDEEMGEAYGADMIVPLKLTVVSGSTMPVSKVQQREESLSLFDKGAIDSEELLKTMEWPRYDEVVTRMNKGPVGEFIDMLLDAGMPEEMTGYLGEISEIDDKKLERGLERGEIPFFNQVFNFEGMVPDRKGEVDIERSMAEVEESKARSRKLAADVKEILARAEKDIASIDQTDERIKIDRAKVASDNRIKEQEIDIKKKEKPELKEVKGATAR